MSGEGPESAPVRVIPLAVPERVAQALVDGCALHNGVRLRRGLRPLSVAEYLAGCLLAGQGAMLSEDQRWLAQAGDNGDNAEEDHGRVDQAL